MRMYAARYACLRAAFSSLTSCKTEPFTSATPQEDYSKILISELKNEVHQPKRQSPPGFEEEASTMHKPTALHSEKKVAKRKSKASVAPREYVDFSQRVPPSSPVTYSLQVPDEASEQHLHEYLSECSTPLPDLSETTIPISSLLSTDQSISKSTSILRYWFRSLNLNALTPTIPQSGNLAPYVYSSYTMNQLVRLGVDLSKLESIPGAANMLIKLDFHQVIEPVIWKLHSYGFSLEQMARLFTVFPKVFRLSLDELDTRIQYFLQHNFAQTDVIQMLYRRPLILSLSPVEVDKQLASVQTVFQLSADELRQAVVTVPKIILHPLGKIKDIYVVLSKMMGFPNDVVRQLVCQNAKLLVTERDRLVQNFVFMHSRLDLPLERIQLWPTALSCATHLLPQRATFLVRRGLFQPDPTKPLYTPLSEVVDGNDAEFCKRFPLVDEAQFNTFLKTL